MPVIRRMLKPLKEGLAHHRIFQYRGSGIVYQALRAASKLYATIFATMEYCVVPTPHGKLYLPKKGYSSGRVVTYMLDMVEPQFQFYFEPLVKRLDEGVLIDVGLPRTAGIPLKPAK